MAEKMNNYELESDNKSSDGEEEKLGLKTNAWEKPGLAQELALLKLIQLDKQYKR